jgi:hypothetical protein
MFGNELEGDGAVGAGSNVGPHLASAAFDAYRALRLPMSR